MKEAYLYEKRDNDVVRCNLCSHRCVIGNGKKGICAVRENTSGILYSLVYGKVIAGHCDPIEKKPLFHFLPGSYSYSIATAGCNFRCLFCQNADISQLPSDRGTIMGEDISPKDIIGIAKKSAASSISYTYTEPTVYYELAVDTARLAVSEGLKNVFVSNGYMTEECLNDIYPDLHAANIDLKSFTDSFYKEQCGAKLEPVLSTIRYMKKMGIWVEVTTLLIPGLNDSDEELKDLAGFLKDVDPDIPWHISRFHPTSRLTDIPPTPVERIRKAREIGYKAGLKYVYTGNVPGDKGEKTYCHNCNETLIDRLGFHVSSNKIKDGQCSKCGTEIPGIWSN